MTSDHESKIFDQLKARIEELHSEESQAIVRANEEREKWIEANKGSIEKKSFDTLPSTTRLR